MLVIGVQRQRQSWCQTAQRSRRGHFALDQRASQLAARLMILLSIAAARKNVRIANAYFIPDDLCLQALVEACRRGVKVEIITPGPDIDARTVRAVGKMRWLALLKAGAHFYEYQPARYHCKYMMVDECWSSVGSANLDNRS